MNTETEQSTQKDEQSTPKGEQSSKKLNTKEPVAHEAILDRPNSVEISINAKGLYSGKVKAYAGTIEDAMEQSLSFAEILESIIKLKNSPKEAPK